MKYTTTKAKLTCLTLFVLWNWVSAYAQYNTSENMSWVFGVHSGINFSSGTPVAFTTDISTGEGSASVSDAAGNLLFYTDGKKVWNSANVLMPSVPASTGIVPLIATNSTTQAAVIVPFPADASKY